MPPCLSELRIAALHGFDNRHGVEYREMRDGFGKVHGRAECGIGAAIVANDGEPLVAQDADIAVRLLPSSTTTWRSLNRSWRSTYVFSSEDFPLPDSPSTSQCGAGSCCP